METASLYGMGIYWVADRAEWSTPLQEGRREIPSEAALQAAAAELQRRWLKRPAAQSWTPWRYDAASQMLNGPTEGADGRIFSTALLAINPWLSFHGEAWQKLNSACLFSLTNIHHLATWWDWQNEEIHRGAPRAEDGPWASPEPLPWPLWADSRTAMRRLLQRAAGLLFEANPEWGKSPFQVPRRNPRRPEGAEWSRVTDLLEFLTQRYAELWFVMPEQLRPGERMANGTAEGQAAVALWAVTRGWGHLRRCESCREWIAHVGRRPQVYCNAACRQRASRAARRQHVTRDNR
ncbi:MAG: hypothetical protein IT317_24815 [Anaerolineales bacterium]|nr:hypothetical protein [Anaerolineales bacterium]